MSLVYRHQKNEPLTIAEMDGNFAGLDQRLKLLETTPVQAEAISAFVQEGDQVTIMGTFGNKLGQVILPKVFFNPRGKWEQGQAYRILDWVQVEKSIYSCSKPHKAENFKADREMWSLVLEI
jgi:hypothetical protein